MEREERLANYRYKIHLEQRITWAYERVDALEEELKTFVEAQHDDFPYVLIDFKNNTHIASCNVCDWRVESYHDPNLNTEEMRVEWANLEAEAESHCCWVTNPHGLKEQSESG